MPSRHPSNEPFLALREISRIVVCTRCSRNIRSVNDIELHDLGNRFLIGLLHVKTTFPAFLLLQTWMLPRLSTECGLRRILNPSIFYSTSKSVSIRFWHKFVPFYTKITRKLEQKLCTKGMLHRLLSLCSSPLRDTCTQPNGYVPVDAYGGSERAALCLRKRSARFPVDF